MIVFSIEPEGISAFTRTKRLTQRAMITAIASVSIQWKSSFLSEGSCSGSSDSCFWVKTLICHSVFLLSVNFMYFNNNECMKNLQDAVLS